MQDFKSSSSSAVEINFLGYEDFPSIQQKITFEDCVFENIDVSRDIPVQNFYFGTVIWANTAFNEVKLKGCEFRDIDVSRKVRRICKSRVCLSFVHSLTHHVYRIRPEQLSTEAS